MTKTGQQILSMLRKEPLTINQLVNDLGLSRNAIVFQLGQLEASGLVEKGQFVHAKRVGKPPVQYKATKAREDSFSKAYPAFASLLMKSIAEELPASKVDSIMKNLGQKMADDLAIDENLNLTDRLKIAREFADTLGAVTELTVEDNQYIIESHNCPLASVVRVDSCVCDAVANYFAKSTGCKVNQLCHRSPEKLLCRFSIKPLEAEVVA